MTTSLFGGYGAILADSRAARRALLDAARRVTGESRAKHLRVKAIDEPVPPPGFSEFALGATATLSLEGGPDEVWRRLRDKTRNAIRKGQKSGLELRVGPRELPHFYDVLAANYHRKGTPIYGYAVMDALCAELGEHAEVVTLRKDGAVICGALVLYDKSTVYVPFCSSRVDAFHFNPNNLVYWEIILRACLRGMKTLDFGRSPLGSGSLAFKLHWGALYLLPRPVGGYTPLRPPVLLRTKRRTQLVLCSEQAGSDGRHRDSECLGDLGVAQPLALDENEHRPFLGRQVGEGSLERPELFAAARLGFRTRARALLGHAETSEHRLEAPDASTMPEGESGRHTA
jgi:hypothetical protein